MKALIYTKNSDLRGLTKKDVKIPEPKPNEILIRVNSSCINNAEANKFKQFIETGKISKKTELINRSGLNRILGTDVSGIVCKVGSNITKFKVGDPVFGITGYFFNAWAEYACLKESHAAIKPDNLSFEESAVIPTTGGTALAAVMKADIKKGDRVLINGATGGVGLFALQIAKSFGAIVTAVCSDSNIDFVKQYGSDNVISYSHNDITKNNSQKYDKILVINGYHPIKDYNKILSPVGRIVVVGGKASQTVSAMLFGPFSNIFKHQKINGTSILMLKGSWMDKLSGLSKNSEIKPFIDEQFAWDDIDKAIEAFVKNHIKGKISLVINSNVN